VLGESGSACGQAVGTPPSRFTVLLRRSAQTRFQAAVCARRFAKIRAFQPSDNVMNWCVYLLLCANGALYAGISNRPQARLAAHLAGKGAKYTRSHRAREMRIVACCLDRSAASKLEWVLKRMTAAQKRALWEMGQPVAANKNKAA